MAFLKIFGQNTREEDKRLDDVENATIKIGNELKKTDNPYEFVEGTVGIQSVYDDEVSKKDANLAFGAGLAGTGFTGYKTAEHFMEAGKLNPLTAAAVGVVTVTMMAVGGFKALKDALTRTHLKSMGNKIHGELMQHGVKRSLQDEGFKEGFMASAYENGLEISSPIPKESPILKMFHAAQDFLGPKKKEVSVVPVQRNDKVQI